MTDDLIQFILDNENANVQELVLKQKEYFGYPASFVANQINGRRRAKDKLPTWYADPHVIYPPQENIEQCSSEITASVKCKILEAEKKLNTIADLTGGFGVDSFFLSQLFKHVFHVEPNAELCSLAKENHKLHGANNITHVQSEAVEFLQQSGQKFDWIYLDPSRRSNGKKIFKLSDSQPDVVELLPRFFLHSGNILVKTSPMLDLKEGARQLAGTRTIHVISIGNECREVLFQLQRGWEDEPEIFCTNFLGGGQEIFTFRFSDEANAKPTLSDPHDFIYEPNASILKAGAFNMTAKKYSLSKIAPHTHLYTSEKYVLDFPGRIFKVISAFEPKALSTSGPTYFNIISRNHPLSVDDIKKKYKLKEGGEKFLLAFSGTQRKYMLVAERLR